MYGVKTLMCMHIQSHNLYCMIIDVSPQTILLFVLLIDKCENNTITQETTVATVLIIEQNL